MKYIDSEKLIAEIERLKNRSQEAKMEFIDEGYNQNAFAEDCRLISFDKLLSFITSLQQEQPIRKAHKESWIEETKKELQHEEELLDMRLEALKRIREKKNQFKQEQSEVELEREIRDYFSKWDYDPYNGVITMDNDIAATLSSIQNVARHFYELGLNTRKEG